MLTGCASPAAPAEPLSLSQEQTLDVWDMIDSLEEFKFTSEGARYLGTTAPLHFEYTGSYTNGGYNIVYNYCYGAPDNEKESMAYDSVSEIDNSEHVTSVVPDKDFITATKTATGYTIEEEAAYKDGTLISTYNVVISNQEITSITGKHSYIHQDNTSSIDDDGGSLREKEEWTTFLTTTE